MTIYSIKDSIIRFVDTDGTPLENGLVYIGEENEDPIKNPVTVYWEKNTVAVQPIRTINGYLSRAGVKSNIYCEPPFSLLILNEAGEKITYQASYQEITATNENLIIDGGFDLANYFYTADALHFGPDNIRTWIAVGSGKNYVQWEQKNFESDQTDIPGNPKHYLRVRCTGNVDPATDYLKVCHCIEDGFSYAGAYLTLSFWAKEDGGDSQLFNFISTSFTFKNRDIDDRITSINPVRHRLGRNWQKYTITFKMPLLFSNLYPSTEESCLILNIWLAAGTDFTGETVNLPDILPIFTYTLNITNIKLERSQEATDFIQEPYESIFERYLRRNETTIESALADTGYMVYVSPGIQNFIPGFRFRAAKRTEAPEILIFPYGSTTPGFVEKVGVGNVAVTSVDDISSQGCGSITLAAPTAAGDVYRYHYFVNDEFTL